MPEAAFSDHCEADRPSTRVSRVSADASNNLDNLLSDIRQIPLIV